MDQKMERMKELVGILNLAGKAYYQESTEIMSNFEYDKLYDELLELEQDTGVVLSNSPTIHVGYEVLSQLPKETHSLPMLSLDKTKEVSQLAAFLGEQKGVLSWKLDGLTIVVTYKEGKLSKAVTRGNGEIGEVVTNNAKTFKNLPYNISYKGELIVRGEAVIKYSDFERINESLGEVEGKYKNPRNLCAGSVRQLNNEITAGRSVNFYPFSLIKADDVQFDNSIKSQLDWLSGIGFDVVDHVCVDKDSVADAVEEFADKIGHYDIPSDGLVLMYDDIAYGLALGNTSKFPRNGLAFKWVDEIADTVLTEIEWSPSRTGLINPVAIFEPVELEGTTVSRASIHNISIMEDLELGIGDNIQVYKANMIIPQIAENKTRSGVKDIPKTCPACGETVEIKNDKGTKTLCCINPDCSAKALKLYVLFTSRNAFNIDGLSEETLKKFIGHGFIQELADIFKLSRYEGEIKTMEGFGEKSFANLVKSLEKARQVSLSKLIYSLGIPNIGLSNAKMICKALGNNLDRIRNATKEELLQIEGVGEIIADTFLEYFHSSHNNEMLDHLLNEVHIEVEELNNKEQLLEGKTFVITGSVNHFNNRNEVKALIEELGGKVTGSVTKNTDYLINNDSLSGSSKNKKAKELGVTIITEDEFLQLLKNKTVNDTLLKYYINEEGDDYADKSTE